ncbi:MAG: type II 3-dehydroquinate dehydratase [Candidatus Omnitrophica bacterium]|nr:type II 3-dehydroquinate dehydratase [Candidatus Omnitrophota bacterium]
MPRILVIHGPNLNLLGKREPEIYGKISLSQINKALKEMAKERGVEIDIVQSNHEGEIVELIGRAEKKFSGIVINPAGYTHTSVAIRDAIEAVKIPTVEVHLSNIYAREDFRHRSLIAPVVDGQVTGFGFYSYLLGLEAVLYLIKEK